MDTIVFTADPLDFGVGAHSDVTFVQCSWHIDDVGTLHIKRENGRGNCAAFARGSWSAVADAGRVAAATKRGA